MELPALHTHSNEIWWFMSHAHLTFVPVKDKLNFYVELSRRLHERFFLMCAHRGENV